MILYAADIFYTKANEAVNKSRTVFTSDEEGRLYNAEHNLGDWLLYQHFNRTFWNKIDKQPDFHEEVLLYKQTAFRRYDYNF